MPKEKWICSEASHEAVISKTLFETVQLLNKVKQNILAYRMKVLWLALQNAVSTNSVYSKNIELTGNEGQSLSKDATVVMMVTPADGTDMQAFAESLTVSKDGSNLALTLPSYNEEDEITNESEINVFATQNAAGKDCVLVGLGKNASVGDQVDSNQ